MIWISALYIYSLVSSFYTVYKGFRSCKKWNNSHKEALLFAMITLILHPLGFLIMFITALEEERLWFGLEKLIWRKVRQSFLKSCRLNLHDWEANPKIKKYRVSTNGITHICISCGKLKYSKEYIKKIKKKKKDIASINSKKYYKQQLRQSIATELIERIEEEKRILEEDL